MTYYYYYLVSQMLPKCYDQNYERCLFVFSVDTLFQLIVLFANNVINSSDMQ